MQNDFQILECMLRGFIASASNADVYTSAIFALQKYLLGNPKPFQICTILVQALKETRSYFFTPLIARMQNAIILRKETMFLVFSPNWLERYCNECGSQCNERADSEIS